MRKKNLLFHAGLLSACLFSVENLKAQSRNGATSNDSVITISRSRDSAEKEVRLLYYTTPRHLTAASTDVVYTKDLIKSPVTNVLNALTGRIAGIYTEQFS